MKYLKFCVVFLLMLFFIPNVYAQELCTKPTYDKLKAKVDEVKVSMKKEEKNGEKYTSIEVTNVDDDLMIYYNGTIYEPKDGTISFTINGDVNNYDLKFYGGYGHACVEEYIATKRIYNKYSEKDECDGNEEWDLCNENYDGYIKNDDEFKEKLDEYLNSDEKKEIEDEKKSEKIKKVLLIGGVAVIIVGGFYAYKNNHNKKTKKK